MTLQDNSTEQENLATQGDPTEQENTTGIRRRRETRSLPPFRRSADALKQCGISLDGTGEFNTDAATYHVDKEELGSMPMTPKFNLDVDVDRLESDTGIDRDDAELLLAARDLASKRYKVLSRWPVDEAPSVWEPTTEVAEGLRNSEGLEFSITICLRRRLDPDLGVESPPTAYRRASILSQKVFAVRTTRYLASFPLRFWPFGDDTLWQVVYLQGDDPNFNASADEVLEVRVNQKVQGIQRTFGGSRRATNIFFGMMGSEIYLSIARRALGPDSGNGGGDGGEQGVRGQIIERLTESSQASEEEVLEWAQASDDGQIRSAVQIMFGITESMS